MTLRISRIPTVLAWCLAAFLCLTWAGCVGDEQPAEVAEPPEPTAEAPAAAGTITPQPIPPGFDFPAQREALQAIADAYDVAAMRTHSWHVWAGMTTDSKSSLHGEPLPIWETWCGTEETFQKECGTLSRPSRQFVKPRQVDHPALEQGPDTAAEIAVVSFNKFNPSMADFVATPHPGPGGVDYDYSGQTSGKTVADLNSAWPAGTPTAERKIVDTPYVPPSPGQQGVAAMELKPVMFVVKGSGGLTPVPFWQGPDASTKPSVPTPETWTTCVLFDPGKPTYDPSFTLRDATPDEVEQAVSAPQLACDSNSYKYAPLGQIYHLEMDAAEAAAYNQAQGDPQGIQAEAGDFAVLAAMHVNTKEIENWTWQTFWWQAGENAPDNFPGGVENQTSDVQNEWTQYAMCSNYLQTQGVDSPKMDVCFNPYLETAFGVEGGLQSNCMSCHGQAIVGGKPAYPKTYKTPIEFNSGPYYAHATSTDFSWAIQNHNK